MSNGTSNEHSSSVGFFTDSAGYEDLASIARSKGSAWSGIARYFERRAHEAAVAEHAAGYEARKIIAAARAGAEGEYFAMLAAERRLEAA